MKVVKIGKPFETDGIENFAGIKEVFNVQALFEGTAIQYTQDDKITLKYKMAKEDIIYGLGENMRGINKRGGIYESFCTDDPSQTPDRRSLYGAHNFFIIDSEPLPVGIFIDFPGRVTFDLGYSHRDDLEVIIDGLDVKIYLISGANKLEIVEQFLRAIGPSFLPPKWAFGYQQSRWSYESAQVVRDLAKSFDQEDIPLDAIYLDIDYMKDYKNFTVDEVAFPDFKNFIKEIKEKGIRLVPIIDAGCKVEEGYFLHEEGVQNKYYCVDEHDQPFVGAVWPGKVHFPDFINPKARQWFGNHYNKLIDLGIEGFWNDMNEPAIFYTEKGLKSAIDHAVACKDKNLDIHTFFQLKDQFVGLSNRLEDYQSFYHKKDEKLYNHLALHNLYGYNMTRAAGEAFEVNYPDKRILLFSRASYIGMHRYGGIWTGDNHGWWEHLLLNIKMMPSLNMCGFIYSGADIGGFGANTDAELLMRWSQFAVYTPLFRNHSCMGTRQQEPFRFDENTTSTLRDIIKFRYAFTSHLYSEFMLSNQHFKMLFKPLSFEYNDQESKQVEDQLLYGSSLMLAPIYQANQLGRYVYLPETMLKWVIKSEHDYTLEAVEKGQHYFNVETEAWLNFIRVNQMVMLNKSCNRTDDIDASVMKCLGYIKDEGAYVLYTDDGISRNTDGEEFVLVASYADKTLTLSHKGSGPVKIIHYEIITTDQVEHKGVYYV